MLLLALVVGLPLMAAETGQINYQARLLDSYGRRLNTTVDLSFKIYDAVTDGNLLWSETQAGVVVQDGVYSVVLGSQTAIPASVFAQNNIYLELGINGETMTPRQQITASAYALTARTIMGSNIYENQTSGYVGVGTTNPAVKLDVSGTIQATGIKMPTGATAGYVLASDANGVGSWQSVSIVVTEHDPIHTNFVKTVFTPATNDLWNAIGTEATTRSAADTTLQSNIDAEATTRATDITSASNALNNAVGLRVLKAGDVMTGPLTNNILFAGNGAGLTNIQAGGVSLTGVVHRIGGAGNEMTGPLVVSNNVTVTLTNEAGYFVATNSISLGGTAITSWLQVGSTADVAAISNVTVGLNAQSNTWDGAAITSVTANAIANGLNAQSNTWDGAAITSVTANAIANGLNSRSNIWDGAAVTAVTANAIANGLNAQSNTWDGAAITSVTANAIANGLNSRSNIWDGAAVTAVTANAIANGLNARSNAWDNAVIMKEARGGDGITIYYSNLYYLASGSTWSNANAITNLTSKGLLGLALGSDPQANGMLINGYFTNAWHFDVGSVIYMDTNVCQITTNRPMGTNNVVRILGYAISSTNIYFNPDRTYIEILGGE